MRRPRTKGGDWRSRAAVATRDTRTGADLPERAARTGPAGSHAEAGALSYDPEADLATLAAAYGYGLARKHPYNHANKRVAFMVMGVKEALGKWVRERTADRSQDRRRG